MASAAYKQFCRDVIDGTSMVELVAEAGGKLRQAGRHQMLCGSPFRNESDPSFRVYVDQNSWYDYGASTGGDPVDFIQELHGVDFNGAIDMLAERLGKKWGNGNGSGEAIDPEVEEEITRIMERRWVEKLSTEAANYYHNKLSKSARAWLQTHYGFSDEIINKQRIGWSDGTLLDYMRKERGYKLDDLLKTGLFIRTQSGRIIEHHEDRITFPYWRGATAPYMISRRVKGETPDTQFQKAKYKKTLTQGENHPYVSRHVRNDILYGEDSAKRPQPILVVTEGVTDAITAIMCGWPVISPVTTRFKKADIDRVLRLSEKAGTVVIANDNEAPRLDERSRKMVQPGFDGAQDTAKVLFEAGRDVRIAILPRPDDVDKVDLNSFVRDNDAKALDAVIRSALAYPEFLVQRVPLDTRPVELDEALSPSYAAIARCGATEREAYINAICKRFSLTQGTVVEAVAEFLRVLKKNDSTILPPPLTPAPTPAPTADESSGDDPPPPSDGEGGGSGSMPPPGMKARGAVYEHPDGYYFAVKKVKDEWVEERLSNFILIPSKFVRAQDGGGKRFCCDIKCINGYIQKDVIFSRGLQSAKYFKDEVQSYSNEFAWSGTDANVTGVNELLLSNDLPEYLGVSSIGYIETKNGPRWVMPDYVLGPNGRDNDSRIIYSEPQAASPIANYVDLKGAELSDDEIRPLAQRVLPEIFALNTPEVIVPLIGWFFAAPVTPVIRAVLGHMSLLCIWGTQGCGKSTLACDIFWPLLGVKSEPLTCADTPFAMLATMSSTTSVPLVYDEFRDLSQRQREVFLNRLRSIYKGAIERRGRQNLTLAVYHVVAPVCVIGEQPFSDPALLERTLCVSPFKNTVTSEISHKIAQLTHEPLQLLGGHYVRFILGRDIREDIKTARALMEAKMLPLLPNKPSSRICDTLLVAVLGYYLHQKWCDQIGVMITDRPQMRDVFKALVGNITESEDGGPAKDIVDLFLEQLSTYAHLGILRENVHYAFVKGKLCLHLESCYEVYLGERRRTNQPDATNGIKSLRRVFKEKFEAGGYIVNISHRVRLGEDERQVRAIQIDPDKVPEHINADRFPMSVNRRQGGQYQRGFDGFN